MEVDEAPASPAPSSSQGLPLDPFDSDPPMPPNADAVAAAAERRLRMQRQEAATSPQGYDAFDENHEKRQEFRRLIDPGILRPNPRSLALEALQTLKMLADNILSHPGDVKYYRFKPTNGKIKRVLVEPKGTIEYARALGFKPEVENLQPFYVFNKRRLNDLRIGTAVLEEVMERELEREAREQRAKEEEKAAKAAQVEKVKMAFLDDRRKKASQDRREAQARAASRRADSTPPSSPTIARAPPGTGYTLRGNVVNVVADMPSPYHDEDDED
ncbi:hypothetical protein B0H21DRAFT_818030 [Amylocystis lapponica]|nr:hypothetical protein B0H21DRAFT_818030 [Amylocystis lapponica]